MVSEIFGRKGGEGDGGEEGHGRGWRRGGWEKSVAWEGDGGEKRRVLCFKEEIHVEEKNRKKECAGNVEY